MSINPSSSEISNNNISLLNAPKCAFRIPTQYPPTLILNESSLSLSDSNYNDINHTIFLQLSLNKEDLTIDSSLSTASESEDEEQSPISILSILEKYV